MNKIPKISLLFRFMRKCTTFTYIALILAVVLASATLHAETPAVQASLPGADTPEGKKTMDKLTSITIPTVNFNNSDIAAILKFLSTKSKELDPEHVGVDFQLTLPESNSKPSRFHRSVTIVLDNVPLPELLPYITQQTNLTFQIEKDIVVCKPPGS